MKTEATSQTPAMDPALADDLAFVRSLAEEGRNAPLIGGVFYVIWGGLIGTAALLSWLDSVGFVSLDGGIESGIWIAAFILGWGLSFLVGRFRPAKAGASTLGNQTAASVWFGVGIFITTFWLALMVVHDNFVSVGVPAGFLFNLMFPVSFGLYGVAFFATATAARASWLRSVGLLSIAFSIATLFLMTSPSHLLVAVVGLICCAIVPGIILMRAEPSTTV